jgi:hypothetical protein
MSPGPKSYIAHILSLFRLCGFPCKLGEKMRSALCDDNDQVDLELSLANGESINVSFKFNMHFLLSFLSILHTFMFLLSFPL